MRGALRICPAQRVMPESQTKSAFAGAARLCGCLRRQAALVIQAGCFTPDDRISQLIATPEDACAMVPCAGRAIPVRGDTEGTTFVAY